MGEGRVEKGLSPLAGERFQEVAPESHNSGPSPLARILPRFVRPSRNFLWSILSCRGHGCCASLRYCRIQVHPRLPGIVGGQLISPATTGSYPRVLGNGAVWTGSMNLSAGPSPLAGSLVCALILGWRLKVYHQAALDLIILESSGRLPWILAAWHHPEARPLHQHQTVGGLIPSLQVQLGVVPTGQLRAVFPSW